MIAYNLLGLFNFALHDDDLGPDLAGRSGGQERALEEIESLRFLLPARRDSRAAQSPTRTLKALRRRDRDLSFKVMRHSGDPLPRLQ